MHRPIWSLIIASKDSVPRSLLTLVNYWYSLRFIRYCLVENGPLLGRVFNKDPGPMLLNYRREIHEWA